MSNSRPHLYISPGPFLRKPNIIEALCHQDILEPLFVQAFDFAIARQDWKELFKVKRPDSDEEVIVCCPKCFRKAQEFCEAPPDELKHVTVWHIYSIVPRDSRLGEQAERLEESA